jgi:DNA-binding CsgD family transcriptional regulator
MVDEAIPLSQREQEILHLVATGATNQQVALELCISVNTVKVHLRNIFSKIGVESRTEATMWAVHRGLITIPNHGQTERETEESELEPEAETPLEPLPMPPEPIPLWKRLLLVVCGLLVLLLALVPPILQRSLYREVISSSAFADQGAPQTDQFLSPTSRWSSRAQMPSPRARLAAASLEGLVYTIGGDVSGAVSDVVEAYNPAENTWQIRTPKPIAVSNIGAIAIDGLIYVPGGMADDGTVIDAMEAYNPIEDEWYSMSSLPAPMCAYAIAAVEKSIYLFGGWDGESYVDTVYIYDTESDTWSQGTPIAVPRAFAGAGTIQGKIYVVGGYDEEREYALCDEYDPALEGSDQSPWRDRTPMTLPRGGVAVSTVEDSLFAVGGGWLNYLAYNERYDLRSNTWHSFESPIVGQWRNLGLVTIDVSLYALGGWSGEYLNRNEEYQALYRVILPMRP